MKEEIKAIVNDIQLVVKDHARMSAQRHVYVSGEVSGRKSLTRSTLCWCWDAHFGARCIGYNRPGAEESICLGPGVELLGRPCMDPWILGCGLSDIARICACISDKQ